MKVSVPKLDPGRLLVLTVTVIMLTVLLMIYYLLLPAWHQWHEARDLAEARSQQYARLHGSLAIKDAVEEQSAALGKDVYATTSDEVALSEFFRQVESIAGREGGVKLINAKPMEARSSEGCRTYPVRLVVSGDLKEVLKFVTRLTAGQTVVALQEFSLRGVQGGNMVECALTLCMVRLTPVPSGD